jgi:hypothetical protein
MNFIGSQASASARPQRSEESQADGGPHPALEEIQASPLMGSPVKAPPNQTGPQEAPAGPSMKRYLAEAYSGSELSAYMARSSRLGRPPQSPNHLL